MKKKKNVKIIFLISFILALPTIINLLLGNFIPSKIFKKASFQNIIKSVALSNYPEWRSIENDLDSSLPNTSSNVSIEFVYGATKKSIEIHITIVTDNELTEEQIGLARGIICDNLSKSSNKYGLVELSAYNFKSYSYKESINCSL